MKDYRKTLKLLRETIPETREQHLFVIVKELDGKYRNTIYNEDKVYDTYEQAEKDILDYSEEKNYKSTIMFFEVVDNKEKILSDNWKARKIYWNILTK